MTNHSATRARRPNKVLSWRGLFAITVWGASFVATRVALEALHPVGLVAMRLLIGTLLMALALRWRGGRFLPARGDLPVCLFLGVMMSTHLLLQAWGLRHTSAMNTGWIIAFIPVTIALGAQVLGQQRLGRVGWAGVAVGTGGVLLVALVRPPNFASARLGDLLQLVSCLTWTIYTLAAAGVTTRNGALRVTMTAMGVAAIAATLVTPATGFLVRPPTWQVLLALSFLGILCSGVGYYLWFAATHDYGPTRVAALLYIEPFVTLVTAAIILREPITLNALAGGLCVLVGVWLVACGTANDG